MGRYREMSSIGRFIWAAGPDVLGTVGRIGFSLAVKAGPLPDGAFVVASNHYSHFDVPVIGIAVRRPVRFLATAELAEANAPMAKMLDWSGSIPLRKDGWPIGAMRTALEILDAGVPVGIFPEATRAAGWGQEPLKRGAAWLAIRANVPLVPVAVKGTDRVFGLDNKLRRGSISVTVGPPLTGTGVEEMMDEWRLWVGTELGR